MTTPPEELSPPLLHIVDLAPITDISELDAIGRAQLESANQRYGGQQLTAKQILAGSEDEEEMEERIHPDYLERGRVIDAWGEPLYDVYLYMVDSGTFFARGTTTIVAEIIQMGIECRDKVLDQALTRALANRPEKLKGKANAPLAAYEEAVKGVLASRKAEE